MMISCSNDDDDDDDGVGSQFAFLHTTLSGLKGIYMSYGIPAI